MLSGVSQHVGSNSSLVRDVLFAIAKEPANSKKALGVGHGPPSNALIPKFRF